MPGMNEAIAAACAADDGQDWNALPPEQRAADLEQAEWMIRIIAQAGFELRPLPQPYQEGSAS